MIRRLSRETQRQMRSAQVITSLVDVVKELVENALDAGSSRVRVQFLARVPSEQRTLYGTASDNDDGYRLDVVDDGSGVAPADYDKLCQAHMTSKIDSFESLDSLETLGFRGASTKKWRAIRIAC